MTPRKQSDQKEFGDFQTPDTLAMTICKRLALEGVVPDIIIEPTCGKGSFIWASLRTFPSAQRILGFDINNNYIEELTTKIGASEFGCDVLLGVSDFFRTNWDNVVSELNGNLLVIGNFPWVTNTVQASNRSANLPCKSNFQNNSGFDSITGKANFDISEWMLIEVLRWFDSRKGYIAMLVKTAVARKIIQYCERSKLPLVKAMIIDIDTKLHFNAAVEACLMLLQLDPKSVKLSYDYIKYTSFDDNKGQRIGHRMGLIVNDLVAFSKREHLISRSPIKWRSGIKHDAAKIMELKSVNGRFINGLNESVELEPTYLFPLMKGSDVATESNWRRLFVLTTQHHVGEETFSIADKAPLTWAYLESKEMILNNRRSIIYSKAPKYSIFGIGEYAFKPWKIAICGLYKNIVFRLVGPLDGKPVLFDDTVYYVGFHNEPDAQVAYKKINSPEYKQLLYSLVFKDDKRPIKAGLLNRIDWSFL